MNEKEIEMTEENTENTETEACEVVEENPMTAKRRQWSAFVEGPAADFFTG